MERNEYMNSLFEFLDKSFYNAELKQYFKIRNRQSELRKEIAELKKEMAMLTPGNPCLSGFKVYSQTDEDGIVADILRRCGDHSRTFIEIGCGRGIENSTHYLALQEYRGCWLDGSQDNINFIAKELGGLVFSNLIIEQEFVSLENIADIVNGHCEFINSSEPSFFSVDVDGNDIHVIEKALSLIKPIVVCAEYNPKFPPPCDLSMPYNPNHTWSGDDYHGASLQAFVGVLNEYKLVSCNLCGCNAFFVRRDRAAGFSDYSPTQLYQPFRENLIDLRSEHYPTLRWLKDKLARN